jgi:hypothetical protein
VTTETFFLPFLHFLWCMAQRSLHAIIKVYYRSMSCMTMVSVTKGPSCTMWVRRFTKYDANLHSTEQDMLPIAFLISKQVVSYQTHGGICCPRVSTSKIRFLVDSSTTYHDGINHLHLSNLCSDHSIDPHTVNSHLYGWKTTTLSQRYKPNSTS